MRYLALIPCLSCVAYTVLLTKLNNEISKRANKLIALFLSISLAWSIFSCILSFYSSPFSRNSIFWDELVVIAIICTFVSYYFFINAYFNNRPGIFAYCGYACVLAVLGVSFVLDINDLLPFAGFSFLDTGIWTLSLIVFLVPITIVTMRLLVKKYRDSKAVRERNEISYFILGLSIAVVFTLIMPVSMLSTYFPIDSIGNLANVLIISLIIRKHNLPDLGIIFRKGIAYSFLGLFVVGVYLTGLFLEIRFEPLMQISGTLITFSCLTLLLFIFFHRLKNTIEKKVDRFFYPNSNDHCQVFVKFNSRIADTIDLEGVANEILSTIVTTLPIPYAELALLNDGNYIGQFSYSKEKFVHKSELVIKQDSPIVSWLARELKPLEIADIPNISELNQLSPDEKEYLLSSKSVLLIPVKGREKMIGIVSLSNRQNKSILCHKEIEFAAEMSKQSGIIIENAQLYSQAKLRANIDELTGLFNHRHFHQRLTEEISRSSRFGDVFSLLMIDLDCFESYNDIHGHLYGDSILKKVGEIIKNNIRGIDVASRYGGDEFSVILPRSSIDDALKIADR